MGRPSMWETEVAKRGPMRSPGHPGHHRAKEREFWDEVATGELPREAAEAWAWLRPWGSGGSVMLAG